MNQPANSLTTAKFGEEKLHPFYLIYSLFYFFPLLFMGASFLEQKTSFWWFSMIALYLAFVGAYLVSGQASSQYRPLGMVAMILLGTLGVTVSVGTSSFFAYLPFYAFLFCPPKQAWRWMGVSAVALLIAVWLSDFVWYFWAPGVGVFVLNTITAYIELQRRQLQKTSERASKFAERERIARNLHDVTGHQLTAIALKAQLAQKLIAKGSYDEAASELTAISELAAQNRAAIRGAIEDEWPSDAVEAYERLIALLESQGFTCTNIGKIPTFTEQARPEVTAIYTEAMTNALRHAVEPSMSAEHNLTATEYTWTLTNPAREDGSHQGLGLKSMQQRARSLGGGLEFSIDAEGQAQLRLSLPLACIV